MVCRTTFGSVFDRLSDTAMLPRPSLPVSILLPSGKAIAGPPGEAGQSLPRYQLRVEGGMLQIAVPVPQLGAAPAPDRAGVVAAVDEPTGPGHDPCLDPAARPRTERRDA